MDSPRAASASAYLDTPQGPRVLAALDEIAATRSVDVATVALAWLAARPTVAAPIASARNTAQLLPLLASLTLDLTPAELSALTEASTV